MSDLVRTKIRSAIKYGLSQITKANDYYNDIADYTDIPKSPNQMKGYPAINIYFEREDCANSIVGNHLQTGGNEALLHNSFIVSFDCFLSSQDDSNLTQERMLADLQKYFGLNYYIPDLHGTRTVFNCIYRGSEGYSLELNTPNCGILVEFQIWYRQYLTNPTLMG